MAPKLKSSQSNEKLKQKSLMSFFGKPAPGDSPSSGARSSQSRVADSSSDPPDATQSSPFPKTPKTRVGSSSAVKNATFSRSSDGGSSHHETPPTSDAIDVDMLSDEEDKAPKPRNVRDMFQINKHTLTLFDNRRGSSARLWSKTRTKKITNPTSRRRRGHLVPRNPAYPSLPPGMKKAKRMKPASTLSLNG